MDFPNFSLQGQVILVTGASRGIGEGLAYALAHAGGHVLAAARDHERLDSVVAGIRQQGGRADGVPLDVSNPADIQRVFSEIPSRFGRLDVLVNNAGIGANHPALEVTEQAWDEMFDVNIKGLFFCCQAAGRIMLAQGKGRIVNMSSQASVVGIRDHAVYCATKGAVNQLTRVLALEWSSRGVNVNAVAPTFIYTPGTAERLDNPEYRRAVVDRIPMGRVGSLRDVSAAVIYLASDAGDLVSGTVLMVDGGWTAQ